MTSVAKGMTFSSYNTRSVIVFGLIVALVIAMFFIPEIVGYSSVSSNGPDEELIARRKARAGEVVALPTAEPKKTVTKDKAEVVPVKKVADEEKFESPLKKLLAYFGSGAKKEAPVGATKEAKIGDSGPMDWRALRSKETKKYFVKAERESRKLAKLVDDEFEQSRYALLNFSNGIRNVLKGSNKNMTADEAIQYLAKLDHDVTTSMIAEGVESSIYNEWADITLGPLFDNTASHQAKVAKRYPFNPKFRLLFVKVFQPPDHYGRFIENGKAYVSFKAAVHGRDIKKITIYHNGVKESERVPRMKKGTTARIFTHLNSDARGVYTFRVYDKRGRFADRSYVFYVPARHFPWVGKKKGKFDLPFSENDPRLDRFFLFQSSQESRQVTYFSREGGSGLPSGAEF